MLHDYRIQFLHCSVKVWRVPCLSINPQNFPMLRSIWLTVHIMPTHAKTEPNSPQSRLNINPFHHTWLTFVLPPTSYPPDWFHGLLDCSSAFLAQQFYFCFSFFSIFGFLNRFPLQLFLVPYSYLLLSTPLLVCFLVTQPHYHHFFQFFIFHKLLVLMH